MKKLVMLVMTMAMVMSMGLTVSAKTHSKEELYAQVTVVTKLDRANDIVTAVDFNGHKWCFEGCEDWLPGDYCTMVMSDNRTPDNIYDDKIVSYRYDGWLDGWFGFNGEGIVLRYFH